MTRVKFKVVAVEDMKVERLVEEEEDKHEEVQAEKVEGPGGTDGVSFACEARVPVLPPWPAKL